MSQNNLQSRSGFTLVELMLAMTFIAVMLVAVAACVIQISTIYNRGITLRQVNQSGRTITDDLTRVINQSTPFSLATNFVEQPYGGRLCTGSYTYIWNTARGMSDGSRNKYVDSSTEIRFVRIADDGAQYCRDPAGGVSPNRQSTIPNNIATDLLKGDDRGLVIHTLSMMPDDSTATIYNATIGQRLYTITFLLGTDNTDALNYNSVTGEASCKPPSDSNSDLTYCSVNQFSFTVRAGVR